MSVKFAMDGQVAIATFAAPPMNLLTIETIEAFGDAAQAALDANARAFLTLAEGDNFCAAADIVSSFLGKDSNFARRMLAKAFAVVHKIEHLPIPTVVAVRGRCLGGGCELMQLHDIVFVGEGAGIGQVEALIGTSTLLGGASRLVSKIGAARAKEMVFSAQIYDAKTLHAWGLINKVFPDADVEAEARAYAHKLAAGPTVAYRYAKALINTTVSNGVSAADLLTMEATPQTFDTEDMRDATKRYAEVGPRMFRDGHQFKGR
jgi:enoyl-CoA hydratase/carnithine racemase